MENLLRPVRGPNHQPDADRRNAAFEKDIQLDPKRIQILRRPQVPAKEERPVITAVTKDQGSKPLLPVRAFPKRRQWAPKRTWHHTELADQRDSLQTMERELRMLETPKKTRTARKPSVTVQRLPQFDICGIGAVGFHRNLKQPGTVAFTTSLYEIDRLIEERQGSFKEELTDDQLVDLKLPPQYHSFKDVFSKAASDTLPPHRTYDHKIELEEGKEINLGFSPLRQQSLEELQATKQYIIEHLGKGFIDQSQAPFAAPILFVRKPNGSLRFCIDFRKLNLVTRKDRYPLPLLDETLARMSRAKVFTKLDIRQAFYRIRIHPDLEDLTSVKCCLLDLLTDLLLGRDI
jgi:hypothetical protein